MHLTPKHFIFIFPKAFDFTTKGILQEACRLTQFWRLRDREGKPPGLIGWLPWLGCGDGERVPRELVGKMLWMLWMVGMVGDVEEMQEFDSVWWLFDAWNPILKMKISYFDGSGVGVTGRFTKWCAEAQQSWGRVRQEVHDQTKPGMIWIKTYEIMVGTLWLCQNSYWKWPFIVDFPIKNCEFP